MADDGYLGSAGVRIVPHRADSNNCQNEYKKNPQLS
jgi:hypothetical protein